MTKCKCNGNVIEPQVYSVVHTKGTYNMINRVSQTAQKASEYDHIDTCQTKYNYPIIGYSNVINV